jgi:hypothetical protein
LAHNSILFEGKFVLDFKVFVEVLELLPFYKSIIGTKPSRVVGEINVDRTLHWILFDGFCNDAICGCGILHLDGRNFFISKKMLEGGPITTMNSWLSTYS